MTHNHARRIHLHGINTSIICHVNKCITAASSDISNASTTVAGWVEGGATAERRSRPRRAHSRCARSHHDPTPHERCPLAEPKSSHPCRHWPSTHAHESPAIGNARIRYVCKYQSCMVSKLPALVLPPGHHPHHSGCLRQVRAPQHPRRTRQPSWSSL